MFNEAMKLKDAYSLEEKLSKPRQHIKKQTSLCQQSSVQSKLMVFPAFPKSDIIAELVCSQHLGSSESHGSVSHVRIMRGSVAENRKKGGDGKTVACPCL